MQINMVSVYMFGLSKMLIQQWTNSHITRFFNPQIG